MILTERQAALVHLMTTPYTHTQTLMRKVVESIIGAPRSEWVDLAEVFLYGWNIAYRDETVQTEPHGMTQEDMDEAGLMLSHLVEQGKIKTKPLIATGASAREVAQAIADDLDFLRDAGILTQCTLLFSIGLQVSPYLGRQEFPRGGPVHEEATRAVIVANPRLFAMIQKGLMDRKGKSSEFVGTAEHIISHECTTRDERMAVLAILMYVVAARGSIKKNNEPEPYDLDFGPMDPKQAN